MTLMVKRAQATDTSRRLAGYFRPSGCRRLSQVNASYYCQLIYARSTLYRNFGRYCCRFAGFADIFAHTPHIFDHDTLRARSTLLALLKIMTEDIIAAARWYALAVQH
jgi:hypothetical protein